MKIKAGVWQSLTFRERMKMLEIASDMNKYTLISNKYREKVSA